MEIESHRSRTRSRSRSPESRSSLSHESSFKSLDRRNVLARRPSNSRYSRESYSRSYTRSISPMRVRSGRYTPCVSSTSSPSSSPPPPRRRYSSRTRSRSSSQSKRQGTREKPNQSRCIGVFGLSVFTTQQKIREIFSKFGPIERIQVVIDAQTGRSRGFCFIYYENLADAKAAKEECCGLEVDDRRIRVDYSITQRPHTPTPGIYMGRPTRAYREREYHDRYRKEYRKRRTPVSSSVQYGNGRANRNRRHERSRSRSYSRRSRY